MERESLEMDVVFVGAGPANLSGALHLARLVKEHNEAVAAGKKKGKALGGIEIGGIEKGATGGAHILSGPGGGPGRVEEVYPGFGQRRAPARTPGEEDLFFVL